MFVLHLKSCCTCEKRSESCEPSSFHLLNNQHPASNLTCFSRFVEPLPSNTNQLRPERRDKLWRLSVLKDLNHLREAVRLLTVVRARKTSEATRKAGERRRVVVRAPSGGEAQNGAWCNTGATRRVCAESP